MEELYKRGVRNFVVDRAWGRSGSGGSDPSPGSGTVVGNYPDANIIVVDDTLAALQRLAAWHRAQFSIPVIGITGSNGKTIVKEWLNQLLEDEYHIARSPKSYNSQIGVPLSVWQLNGSHELAIFEAGISRRGEMQQLRRRSFSRRSVCSPISARRIAKDLPGLPTRRRKRPSLFDHCRAIIYCKDQPVVEAALAVSPKLATRGSPCNPQLPRRTQPNFLLGP